MGFGQSKWLTEKNKVLSVISLNYSGILLSPFEFFSSQSLQMTKIQQSLSKQYKKLLTKYNQQFNQDKKLNKFKWSLGKIDQKMQEQRYSPLYNKNVGINKNNRLMGEDEFKEEWQKVFNKNIQAFKQKDPGFKYTQAEMKQAKDFDLLCYQSMLMHLYQKIENFSATVVQGLDVKKYKQFMQFMFDKSFLDQQKKLKKTLDAMKSEKIDIVFAQEANKRLVNKLKSINDYVVFTRENSESIIIVRKDKFRRFYNEEDSPLRFLPELEEKLTWNNDTVVAFVDNLILISGHLSSKQDKNPQQVYQMMQSLSKLHFIYPMCHIIVGCDANSFVPNTFSEYRSLNKIQCSCNQSYKDNKQSNLKRKNIKCTCYQPQSWVIHPNIPSTFTTSKTRTYLQPQVNKAEVKAEVCRDHLIVFKGDDISIHNQNVCTILNKSSKQITNLPCQEHPYDHYVVKAIVTVNVMTNLEKQENKQSGCFH